MHLDTAYKNFFNRTADFPKFKSRKRGGSFTVPQFCHIENGYVHVPKFKEGLKIKEHRKVKGAKIHETLANSRKDWQHKVSADIVRRYDTICIEDLGVKQMEEKKTKAGKKNRLSKSISDAGWSSLVAMIVYKAEMNDKTVFKVDRYYPSSKTCSICGCKNDSLMLADRSWTCPQCGTIHDRDVNAAANILSEGLRVSNSIKSSAGTVDYTGGGSVRPTSVGSRRRSQKPKSL